MLRFLIIALICSSCIGQKELSIFTEYVSLETLPSYRIGTPDPALYCPDIGERLHIHWSFADKYPSSEGLRLHLMVLFGNNEEDEVWLNLLTTTGTYVYSLMNENYWAMEGIFTYKVEIYQGECLIKEWRHQLWSPRIHIGPS